MKTKQTATAKATATSKYIMTCVFETTDENLAMETFQNAICKLEETFCIKIAHLQRAGTSAPNSPERPVLERIQTLRPEDFSSWDINCDKCHAGVQHKHITFSPKAGR